MIYTNYEFEYVAMVTLTRLLWSLLLLWVGVDRPHYIYLLIELCLISLNNLFLKFNSRPKFLYLCLNFGICKPNLYGVGLLLRLSVCKTRHLLVCGVTNQLSILKQYFIDLKRFTDLYFKIRQQFSD